VILGQRSGQRGEIGREPRSTARTRQIEIGQRGAGRYLLVTRKDCVLVAVPPLVVTAIGPVVAPLGTVAVIFVSETNVKAALTPWKVTLLVPVKPEPVIVTGVPTRPLVGVNEEIFGAGVWAVTVKLVLLVPVPPLVVVTAIGPVVAPLGTVALIVVSETKVKAALTPLKVTWLAPVKPEPLMVTVVPIGPLVGVKVEMVGGAGAAPELGVTANSHVRQDVDEVVPPARPYWFASQTVPTAPLAAAGSGLAPE
jgi:hypothetical protein